MSDVCREHFSRVFACRIKSSYDSFLIFYIFDTMKVTYGET